MLSWLRALAWQWIGIVIVMVGALLVFAKIGEDVFNHESTGFDGTIRTWTIAHQSAFGLKLFTWITLAGSVAPMAAFAVIAAVWLWRSHGRHVAAVVVSAAAASTMTFLAIKHIFGRVRPFGGSTLRSVTYSFPSGHATVSAAVWTSIGYVIWRERLIRGRAALAICGAVVLLIGLSRIYLDVHWATDVLGGWCLGIGVAAASAAMYEHWRPQESASRPSPLAAPHSPPEPL